MTANAQTRAEALLDMCAPRISAAATAVRGYTLIAESLGPGVAGWAYADLGEGEGHRRPCESARAIESWRPSSTAWALVLAGIPGTGKTITAARHVAERGGLLLQGPTADRWGYGGGVTMIRAESSRWILIDDLGDEKTKPGTDNLTTLLTRRAARGWPTLITTMLPLSLPAAKDDGGETIAKRYGDHVASRLRAGYRRLYRRDREDIRADVRPSLIGYSRAARLDAAARRLRSVADAGVLGCEAEALLERFAEIAGVNMSGADFAAAVERRTTETRRKAELAERALLELQAREAKATTDATADALAWLDSLPELEDPT